MSEATVNYRVGVDVGGTFTDIVVVGSDGSMYTKKVSSDKEGYGRAVARAIGQCLQQGTIEPHLVREILHGTTVATNAVLEKKGGPSGLITTKGFRDVLELRRIRHPRIWDPFWERPEPLVPRQFRFEVDERIGPDATVLKPLAIDDVRAALTEMVGLGLRSVGVCLLHADINPMHEQEIGALARAEFPQLYVSLSSEVSPMMGEYERTSTTVTNAYVMPVVSGYLPEMRVEIGGLGVDAPTFLMQSNGGLMTSRWAEKFPVFSLESGPAAGVVGCTRLAELLGETSLIAFDMGGTTAKAAIVVDGKPERSPEYEVGAPISVASRLLKGGGYLIRVRALDVAEIGAGGGSILSIDPGGAMRVGPASAGSIPGPICYGSGGTSPTVTDANVLLGYLNPRHLLGGDLALNVELAHEVFSRQIAGPLGLPLERAAYGAHLLANENMTRAVRAISTERGHDARRLTLVAFGGGGPMHAAGLARTMGMRRVVVPPAPGLFSAVGLLTVPVRLEFTRSVTRLLRSLQPQQWTSIFNELRREAENVLETEGFGTHSASLTRVFEARYRGQLHELTLEVPGAEVTAATIAALETAFDDQHARTYNHTTEHPVEVVNLRLIAEVAATGTASLNDEGWPLSDLTAEHPAAADGSPRTREAYFGEEFGFLSAKLLTRSDLSADWVDGPVILDEYDTTVVIPPDFRARLDRRGLRAVIMERTGA